MLSPVAEVRFRKPENQMSIYPPTDLPRRDIHDVYI